MNEWMCVNNVTAYSALPSAVLVLIFSSQLCYLLFAAVTITITITIVTLCTLMYKIKSSSSLLQSQYSLGSDVKGAVIKMWLKSSRLNSFEQVSK